VFRLALIRVQRSSQDIGLHSLLTTKNLNFVA